MDDEYEDLERLFARQTLHEYLLEIMHLNVFMQAPDPLESFRSFRKEFLIRMDVDEPDPAAARVSGQAYAMAQNFMDKVEDQISDQIKKLGR